VDYLVPAHLARVYTGDKKDYRYVNHYLAARTTSCFTRFGTRNFLTYDFILGSVPKIQNDGIIRTVMGYARLSNLCSWFIAILCRREKSEISALMEELTK